MDVIRYISQQNENFWILCTAKKLFGEKSDERSEVKIDLFTDLDQFHQKIMQQWQYNVVKSPSFEIMHFKCLNFMFKFQKHFCVKYARNKEWTDKNVAYYYSPNLCWKERNNNFPLWIWMQGENSMNAIHTFQSFVFNLT